MKAILKLSIPLFFILTVFSCNKVNEIEKETTKVIACYDETKSADPWFKGKVDDSILISNIKNYLLSDTITVDTVFISLDGHFDPCYASFCPTGRRIKVLLNSYDLIKIQKIKFYECN